MRGWICTRLIKWMDMYMPPEPKSTLGGRGKTKSWLPVRMPAIRRARIHPGGQLSPDKKRRGPYSGKIVFGLLTKTILR